MSVKFACIELVDDKGRIHAMHLERIESYSCGNEIVTEGDPFNDEWVTRKPTGKVTITVVGFRRQK